MNDFSNFDHLFDPVIVINQKQEMVYFNNQSNVFFKLPPRILRSIKSLNELFNAEDLMNWFDVALKSPDVSLSPEMKLSLVNDPETSYVAIFKVIPLKDSLTALVIHDVTVETNLHSKYRDQMEELKKTHAQILQADKLTTLGELTANISHEINNPLTIAAGHSEIIRDLLDIPNPIGKLNVLKSANAAVVESLERVNQIIKGMKDFLHQSEEKKEYCDLSTLLDTSVDWINPQARKALITIEKSYSHSAVALVNRIKIEQVLINLMKNSIDAIAASGREHGKIKLTITKDEFEQKTVIDIIDNGPGMPEAIRDNLFRPFQSTKDHGAGTGLGLSICQKIIDSHQGRIELLHSTEGCHFRIKLPLIELYSYTRNDHSLLGKVKKKRILVVDNEVQILNILNSFISGEDLVFIGSSDPVHALSFIEKANVDLIVTDINMPGMTGSDFSAKARELGYRGPILYMTSSKYVDQFNRDKKELDISGLIVKPFSKDDVMKTIEATLEGKEG